MVPVNLYDTLTFTKNNKHGLNFQIKGASFLDSDEDNLVVKAVRAFEQVSRTKVNYDILLEKKIPYGAGLGGGSGNAAGTLKVLNYIFRNSTESDGLINPESLNEIALNLCSDVPFFLKPGPAGIRDRGEKLRKNTVKDASELEEYANDCNAEFVYLFKENKWHVLNVYDSGDFVLLESILKP